MKPVTNGYSDIERAAIYRVIRERRDVRTGYLPGALDDGTIERLLRAAHNAPSVGLMQPWRFIVVRDAGLRAAVHGNFLEANSAAAAIYRGERAEFYSGLKLEGLLEAPQHLCVVCDGTSQQGHGLGRHTIPQSAAYSVVCAVQNLWLAARAEGVGVGWISIVDPPGIKKLLRIPEHMDLVAYLCLGYVRKFAATPDLERAGWEFRVDAASLIRADFFDQPYSCSQADQ